MSDIKDLLRNQVWTDYISDEHEQMVKGMPRIIVTQEVNGYAIWLNHLIRFLPHADREDAIAEAKRRSKKAVESWSDR